jgi:Chlorophyll A-B binding protein
LSFFSAPSWWIRAVAFAGAVAQEAHPLGLYPDSPGLFTQAHDWGAHNGSLLQILIFTSLFEALTTPAVIQMLKGETDREAGDFCLDPLGAGKKDMARMRLSEIKNGRLAMRTFPVLNHLGHGSLQSVHRLTHNLRVLLIFRHPFFSLVTVGISGVLTTEVLSGQPILGMLLSGHVLPSF